MVDRLRQIMEDQGLTQKTFSSMVGISEPTLCGILKGRTKPSLNLIEGIKKSFPNINLEWLMYGSQPMYINNNVETAEQSASVASRSHGAEEPSLDFSSPAQATAPSSPSLFDAAQMQSVSHTPKKIAHAEVKYIDRLPKRITEIRVFYDDQTWETFVPKR